MCSLVSKLPLPRECEALSPGHSSVRQRARNPSCVTGRETKTEKGDLLTVTQLVGSGQNLEVPVFVHRPPVCTNVTVHLHIKGCCAQVFLRPLFWLGREILPNVSERARKESTYVLGSSIAKKGQSPGSTLIVVGTHRPGHLLNFCLK